MYGHGVVRELVSGENASMGLITLTRFPAAPFSLVVKILSVFLDADPHGVALQIENTDHP